MKSEVFNQGAAESFRCASEVWREFIKDLGEVAACLPSRRVGGRTSAFPGDSVDPSVRFFFPVSRRSPLGADTRPRSPPCSPRSRSYFPTKTCEDTSINGKELILNGTYKEVSSQFP